MFAPGVGAPAYQKPFGERWQHSFSSWVTKRTSENPVQVILHTTRNQDVLSKYLTTLSGWDYYSFQVGFSSAQYLRQRTTFPAEYQLKLLTGETMVFDGSGRLTEIWDTLATPQKVLLAYDGNGRLSTVTDATAKRRLLFAHDVLTQRMTSVSFQLLISAVWTTQHTTTYGYTLGNLTSVTIGGELAQTNVYDAAGYLTQIKDGENNSIVAFAYDSTTAGRVARIDTARGMVGYELASTRAACSGKTVLYFNRGNTTSCSVDGECGSGFLCGGKTGIGTTGVCFRAARCLTIASPSDDVVTNVTALGPPGETCDGACLDVAQYIWKTLDGTTPVLQLEATQDPSGVFITKEYNSNGLPTRITYGDPDANPSNGNGAREVFLSYNATFPGKLAEVRRKSPTSTSTCSASVVARSRSSRTPPTANST